MQIADTEQTKAGRSETESQNQPIKVLLIEDNPGDARLIQLMLADGGPDMFMLERVDHLSLGMTRLAEGDFDIVLADLSLPDSHGLETFQRLHAQAPQMPLIVLSGLNDTTVAVNAGH